MLRRLIFFSSLGLSILSWAKDRELRIGLAAEFETLNPIVNSSIAAIYVLDATQRPLVAMSPDGLVYAELLQDVPSFANQGVKKRPDGGLQVFLKFKPGLTWDDGAPLGCEDLKFAWEVGQSITVSAPNHADYENIDAIYQDPKNSGTCILQMKQARAHFLQSLPKLLPAHVEKPIFEKYKTEPLAYERNTLYIKEPWHPGLYNGPYRVSSLKLGSEVVLQKNSHWKGKIPFFESVIFRFITNTSALEANLFSGSLDMTAASGFSLDQALVIDKKIKQQNLPYEVILTSATSLAHLDLNLDNPILSDVRVRQALYFALDRKELCQAFFQGRLSPADHFSYPQDRWFLGKQGNYTHYPFDRNKAKILLQQAGWRAGAGPYLEKQGEKLSLTISSTTDQRLNEMVETYLKETWKKIGIELKIKNYPSRIFFSEITRHRQFEIAYYSWVTEPNFVPRLNFSEDSIPGPENSWSGQNRSGWKNKIASEALQKAVNEFDESLQSSNVRTALRQMTEELPILPLYYKMNSSVIPKDMKGFHLSGHLWTEYLKIEDWSLTPRDNGSRVQIPAPSAGD